LRQFDRPVITHALQFARWVIRAGFHQLDDCVRDRHPRPDTLGKVVHEQVIAFLRVLPRVKDLRHGDHIFVRKISTHVDTLEKSPHPT
jgi:hypothetical protein